MQKQICFYPELDNLAKEIYGRLLSKLEGRKTPAQLHEENGFIDT
jgi:hypothetical protein